MDQNVPRAITNGLRLRGVNVLTAFEDGAAELDDPALLERAGELHRVLFTRDDDLLAEATQRQHAGVAFAGVIFWASAPGIYRCLRSRSGDHRERQRTGGLGQRRCVLATVSRQGTALGSPCLGSDTIQARCTELDPTPIRPRPLFPDDMMRAVRNQYSRFPWHDSSDVRLLSIERSDWFR